MQTFCKLCKCWIDSPVFELHVQEQHHITIAEQALKAITKTSSQVQYVMEHYPECYNNDGALIARILRIWQFRNVRAIYDQQTGELELKGSYEDLIYCLKHTSTITRLGRAYRAKNKRNEDTKAVQRLVQENFSRSFWAANKVIP